MWFLCKNTTVERFYGHVKLRWKFVHIVKHVTEYRYHPTLRRTITDLQLFLKGRFPSNRHIINRNSINKTEFKANPYTAFKKKKKKYIII